MKNIITLLIFAFLCIDAAAQQDAGFSMYFFNPVYVNPGYAGSRELFSGSIVHRSQWINMPGAPTSQAVSLHSALPNTRAGLGLQVYNDVVGPMKNTGLNFTYAYHIPVTSKAKLSLGLTGMMNNIRIGMDQINIDDNADPSFVGNASSKWVPDAGFGAYLYKERFYAGLSANHLVQSRFGLSETAGADDAKFFRQYYLTTGVVVPVSESVDFRPSLLVKYVQSAPLIVELNGSFIFFQKLFIGAGFRTSKRTAIPGGDNMIIGIVQLEIARTLRFGYAYDYYLNRTGSYNSGTHELMIGWDISGKSTKISSPRFF
jgi:type IX secretion system PorP/SprF family membrane protein